MREMARSLKSFGKMSNEEISAVTGLGPDEIADL
jgi:hypothetical protein